MTPITSYLPIVGLGRDAIDPHSHSAIAQRWLAQRGGALDFREHALVNRGQPYPIAVALGADPATILGAVTPVPDSLSEYQFAGLLRGSRTDLVKAIGSELRRLYDDVVQEPVPDDFLELLHKIDEKLGSKGKQTA